MRRVHPRPPSSLDTAKPSFLADGDGQRSGGSGSSGTGGVEAQRHELPLMKSSAFFGDDVGGVALEDDVGGGVSLSSSVPGNLGGLSTYQHHHAGGAYSTGASPSRGGGGGGSGGATSTPSPGRVDGSSLVAALHNQLSF